MKKTPNLRQFMTSVILHRKGLIKRKQSCKNEATMNLLIDQLYNKWLEVYKDANFIQLANFFVHQQDKFLELMPGEKSTHYAKFAEQFNLHLDFANNILNEDPKYFKAKALYKQFQNNISKLFDGKVQSQVILHNVPENCFGIMSIFNDDTKVHKAVASVNTNNELFLLAKK